MYTRPLYQTVMERLADPRGFMQILAGPRQVGKTTLARQIVKSIACPSHYVSSDGYSSHDANWIEEQWEVGRQLAKKTTNELGALLILDEIQKISSWADVVKRLWDEDTYNHLNLKVMILGSSTLLIQTGLGESCAGRFESIPIAHWSFQECRDAFDWSLDEYLYFGGYPGAAILIKDEERWSHYIIDAMIETSISRDVMLMARIHKPALLRRVFELGCLYTGHVISYQKMLGQLQDAGNAATLAHYLELLSGARLLTGLQKFSLNPIRQKASSPKLQVLNTALSTAQSHFSFEATKQNKEAWRKLTECAIGAHLINSSFGTKTDIFYWKENHKSIDFILQKGGKLTVVEILHAQKEKKIQAVNMFAQKYQPTKIIYIDQGEVPVEEFLLSSFEDWV